MVQAEDVWEILYGIFSNKPNSTLLSSCIYSVFPFILCINIWFFSYIKLWKDVKFVTIFKWQNTFQLRTATVRQHYM